MRITDTLRFALVAVAAFVIIVACSGTEHGELERPGVRGVRVETLTLKPTPVVYETNGTIKAETVSTVSSRVMGEVIKVHVSEGQSITKGQLLVTIDDRDMAQKVKSAEKAYEEANTMVASAREQAALAEKTYERMKGLFDKNALSAHEFDQTKTERSVRANEFKRAEAMLLRAGSGLQEARLYKGYTKVMAPIDSVVIRKHINSGSMAAPGAPLVTIEDPSAFKLEVNVDARYQNAINVGKSVDVEFPSLGKSCTAHVARVVPNINPATRTFPVEIKSDGSRPEGMRTGLYAKVRFAVDETEALMVPEEAVVKKGQLEGVYVVDEQGVVLYRLVRTGGNRYMGRVEVVSGLKAGDSVITGGIDNAVDGGILIKE